MRPTPEPRDAVSGENKRVMSHRGTARILVIDDVEQNRAVLRRLLEAEGYEVTTAQSGIEAQCLTLTAPPDLVLCDVHMPEMSGVELCRALKECERTRLLPVVLVTGLGDGASRLAAIDAGADDFISKPFDTIELRARIRSLVRLKTYTDELESAESLLLSLAFTVEARDPYTHGHCGRLSKYAVAVGRRLGLDDHELKALHRGGYLHDVGKIAIPDAILHKHSALTPFEFNVMTEHTIIGERLCGELRSLALVRPIIRSHHERLDGSGYPDGLSGSDVPLLAQITSIADTYDAITTDRPYRRAQSPERALAELTSDANAGRLDRELVTTFADYLHSELASDSEGALQRRGPHTSG
jgi:putative two-component system response regulator